VGLVSVAAARLPTDDHSLGDERQARDNPEAATTIVDPGFGVWLEDLAASSSAAAPDPENGKVGLLMR
jgi:hypothetical protein